MLLLSLSIASAGPDGLTEAPFPVLGWWLGRPLYPASSPDSSYSRGAVVRLCEREGDNQFPDNGGWRGQGPQRPTSPGAGLRGGADGALRTADRVRCGPDR